MGTKSVRTILAAIKQGASEEECFGWLVKWKQYKAKDFQNMQPRSRQREKRHEAIDRWQKENNEEVQIIDEPYGTKTYYTAIRVYLKSVECAFYAKNYKSAYELSTKLGRLMNTFRKRYRENLFKGPIKKINKSDRTASRDSSPVL